MSSGERLEAARAMHRLLPFQRAIVEQLLEEDGLCVLAAGMGLHQVRPWPAWVPATANLVQASPPCAPPVLPELPTLAPWRQCRRPHARRAGGGGAGAPAVRSARRPLAARRRAARGRSALAARRPAVGAAAHRPRPAGSPPGRCAPRRRAPHAAPRLPRPPLSTRPRPAGLLAKPAPNQRAVVPPSSQAGRLAARPQPSITS